MGIPAGYANDYRRIMSAIAVRTRRAEVGLLAALGVLAAAGWAVTALRMRGMDAGPNTDPGSAGFFVGVWVVMMAAMMLPSAAPMVAVYAGIQRSRAAVALFAGGYLALWTAAGVVAYALAVAARHSSIDVLSWQRDGRYAVAAVLAAAALYEITPWKERCLARCRAPLGFVITNWRDGPVGASRMGAVHGAWCLGCCWALMASLFALGIMSVTWMALVALLVAGEKLLPWGRAATRGVAALLVALAVAIAIDPASVPGLTLPMGM
jgi:predicted metal-binding membrane protein